MSKVDLVYCACGNARFAEIAIEAGFTYGAQALRTFYYPIEFADLDPNNIPPKAAYLSALAEHKPRMATVMDWERWDQLPEVLAWAEEAAAYIETVIVIPKVIGGIASLPRIIGGKGVRLGYSVPTAHGGTAVPIWEFGGWPVHLLGGSPHQQRQLAYYLEVISVDGNMAHKMALGQSRAGVVSVWQANKRKHEKGHWVPLDKYRAGEFGLGAVEEDAPYTAFEYSCKNIMALWRGGAR